MSLTKWKCIYLFIRNIYKDTNASVLYKKTAINASPVKKKKI